MKITRSSKSKLFILTFLFLFGFFGVKKSIASDSDVFFVENNVENKREIIKSASEYDYPPFSIVRENGEADGFSVELLKAVSSDQAMDITFFTGPWLEIKEDLANGKIDVLPLVGRTPEREIFYDFTVPYMTIYGGVFVKNDNIDINNQEDLYNKKILVMEGDNAEEYLRRKEYSKNIFTTTTFEEAFLKLSQEDYDLVIANELVGRQLLKKLGINNIKLSFKINDFKQDWSFAVKKGDSELLARLNNGLSRVISSGTFEIIKSKWIPEEDNEFLDKDVLWSGQELSLKANFIAKKTEIVLDNYIKNTKLLYELPGIKQLLVQVNETGVLTDNEFEKKFYPRDKDENWENVHKYFINFYNNNSESIESVRLFHKNGYIVNGVLFGKEDVNDYRLDLNWFQDLIDPEKTKEGEVYVSSINIPLISDAPTIRFAIPIDDNGERLGFLIINYMADSVIDFLDDRENVLLVDKKFQDINGHIISDWAVTLKDFREKENILDLRQSASSIKNSSLLEGQNGFLEFFDEGRLKSGAYQKINISDKEWYVIAFNDFEENIKISEDEYLFKANYGYERYITWFIIVSFLFLIILLILGYFKIIDLKRKALLAISVITFLSVCVFFAFFTSLLIGDLKNQFKENHIEQNHFSEKVVYSKVESILNIIEKDLEYAAENFYKLDCNENNKCLEILINSFNRSEDIVYSAYRVNKEGVIESAYPEEDNVLGSYVGDQDYIIKIEKERRTVVSDVFEAPGGFRVISINYPIFDDSGYDGTVSFLVKVEDSLESIVSFSKNNNEIYLLDSLGNIISSSKKENIGRNIFDLEKYFSVIDGFNGLLDSHSSGFREFSFQGKNIILSYTPIFIEGNSWYVITESLEESVYFGLDKTLHNVWIFTFIILAVLAVFAYFLNLFLTKALRMEVDSRTEELKRKTDFITEQLGKEEKNNKEKEALLKKQKIIEKNLESKIVEMEKFQKLVVDREIRMVELKQELNEVKNVSKKKVKK